MSKKRKPRRGWEPSSFYSFPYLSPEDFQSIAETLHIAEIPEDVRSELQELVRDYLSEKHHLADIPRKAEVKAALLEVQNRAEKLMNSIEQLDTVSLHKLELTEVFTSEELNDLQNGQSDIHKIHSAAHKALKDLGLDKGGRPRQKAALRAFICELKGIFEKVTGSRATITWHERYGGLFFDFVHRCLKIVDPEEIYSNDSLGQQIKQALASAKAIPG